MNSGSNASPSDLTPIGTNNAAQDIDLVEGSRYSTFTVFPNLPLELRRQIWVESFPKPRSIKLLKDEALLDPNGNPERFEVVRSLANKCAQDNFPATLSVNKESRTETLLHYLVVPNPGIKVAPYFLNPNKDTVCLDVLSLSGFGEYTWKKNCWLSQLDKAMVDSCLTKLHAVDFNFYIELLKPSIR